MNPYFTLQTRMAALTRNASKFPGFHSTEADAVSLHRSIAPYIDREQAIVDVGCGNAALWFAKSPFNGHDRIFALDVQRHTAWSRSDRPANLMFMNAWPAAFPRTDASPFTVFVKNVFPFFTTGADYQRLFWSLPVGTKTLIIVQPQTAYAENSRLMLNRYPFVRTTTIPWEDASRLLWFIVVIQNFQTQWASIASIRASHGHVEACPDCNFESKMEFDFLSENGSGQAVCMNCGFNRVFPDAALPDEISALWNKWRVADYTMTDTHRM